MQVSEDFTRSRAAATTVARPDASRTSKDGPVTFATIFAWVMSAVCAALCAVVRGALDGPHWLVFAKAFLLLAAAIAAVILALSRIERRGGSYATVLIVALAVLFLPGLALPMGRAVDFFIYPILLALLVAGIRQIAAVVRHMPPRRTLAAMGLGLLAGAGYFLLVNSRGYASVLSPEQAVIGVQNLDTLFHASIANMIVKYGALSTGLDGLVPTRYHFLSHFWFGCIGLWLGTGTLAAYYIGVQVIAIPMLFFSLSLAVHLQRPSGERMRSGALIVLTPLLLLLLTEIWGVSSYLISESYCFASIIFLLSLPLLAEMARTKLRRTLLAQAACLAVVGTLMGMSKVSVGAVFLPAVAYLLLRQLALKTATFLGLSGVALGLGAVTVVALFHLFAGSLEAIAPLSFLWDYPGGAWPSLVANSLLLAVAVAVWLLGSQPDRRCAEAFAIIAVGATVPALLLEIPGGSAYYFIHVGTIAAAVFIAAYGGPLLERNVPSLFRPELVFAAILLVIAGTPQKTGSPKALGDAFAGLQERTRSYLGDGARPATSVEGRLIALVAPGDFPHGVQRMPRAQALQTLLDAGLARAPGAAVFVPPENSYFWSNYHDCRAVSLFVPAMLGVPMVRGLNGVATGCWKEPYFGFSAYTADAISQPSTDAELCARAARWGLRTIFILATLREARKVACETLPGRGQGGR